jgi:hypothetical protein
MNSVIIPSLAGLLAESPKVFEIPLSYFPNFGVTELPLLQPRAALALAVAQGGVETLQLSDSCKGDLISTTEPQKVRRR